MDVRNHETELKQLAEFVHDEWQKRLKAYEAQPRDAAEHFETENEVLSGGYAYRPWYELVQNATDAILEAAEPQGRIHVFAADLADQHVDWLHAVLGGHVGDHHRVS